ncbi:hypothetical protein [Aequorivita viscosa]|uniref:Uncharacterized protein n=1 Tax=Aequorivita viscosa TaxID=797419 RepID=A0A1M6J1D4_9FLAO|nr:hypothetical protein [Aequorivita viscosa]SDX08143.1 hypothetical protein SAMN05216556_11662 [Aequorivita viscosa]SHJ40505.1 hypothetical protein SAMN04487908_1164 [Aequorivita viscosa]
MTDTLIAIISIFIGILGALLLSVFKKKYSMGFTGNTIAGIFGSIFFIKIFGRLGFDPISIMKTGEVNYALFAINMAVSLVGGAIGLLVTKLIVTKMNQKK